ncbi:MAG: diguanylate cyclase [Eubacteriales bacterium]|nr:diguanylate cyclase [Eubacteriales bacterium]
MSNYYDSFKIALKLFDKIKDYDYLTGLPGRSSLMRFLNDFPQTNRNSIAVIMADANGFKQINDSFGYEFGDQLLQLSAEIIYSQCRSGELVFRAGGDEFVIIMPESDIIEAEKRVMTLRQIFSSVEHNSTGLSYSFGSSAGSVLEISASKLFSLAENNMYKQKMIESPGIRGRRIHTIVQTLNETHPREELHSRRVGWLCAKLGEAAGLSDSALREIRVAGMMHDIGKIAISDTVLDKRGPLDTNEKARMRKHPEIGFRILNTVYGANDLAESVLCHHERWDGSGYPRRLHGEEIPLGARIVAIADTFDAITSDRPYRKAASAVYARHEIIKNAGSQFDPMLADIFARQSSSWS